MRRGILIGRLFGTNIYCELSFFLLVALYFFAFDAAEAAGYSAAIFISVLLHEFGHVLAVRRYLKTESLVVLWMLGGLTIYRGAPTPGQQAAISLMGPLFSLAFGALAFGLSLLLPEPPLLFWFLRLLAIINAIWTVANLLPALPLDGGQALRAGLRAGIGRPKADPIMRVISLVTASAIVGVGIWIKEPVAAVLGAFLFLDNLKPTGILYH